MWIAHARLIAGVATLEMLIGAALHAQDPVMRPNPGEKAFTSARGRRSPLGDTPETEAAVAAALQWLKTH